MTGGGAFAALNLEKCKELYAKTEPFGRGFCFAEMFFVLRKAAGASPRPTVCHLSFGGRHICRAAPWCRREMFAHFSAGEGEIGAAAPNGMKIKNGGSKPPPYASRRSHYSSFLIHFSAAPSALREKFSTKKIFRPETGINAHGIYTCKTKSNRFLSFR